MAMPPTQRIEVTVYECENNGDLEYAHTILGTTGIPYLVASEEIDEDEEVGIIMIEVSEGTAQQFINAVRAVPDSDILSFSTHV